MGSLCRVDCYGLSVQSKVLWALYTAQSVVGSMFRVECYRLYIQIIVLWSLYKYRV